MKQILRILIVVMALISPLMLTLQLVILPIDYIVTGNAHSFIDGYCIIWDYLRKKAGQSKAKKVMETVRYKNNWPWGVDIMHIATDGKATVGVSKQDGFDYAFIHDLVVHESVRKQRIGQYLLDLAELEAIRTFKCNLVVLRVVPGSWVEQWYRKNGYCDREPEYELDGYIELGKLL